MKTGDDRVYLSHIYNRSELVLSGDILLIHRSLRYVIQLSGSGTALARQARVYVAMPIASVFLTSLHVGVVDAGVK